MKKVHLSILLSLVLLISLVAPARAEEFTGEAGWQVEYNGKLVANFTTGAIAERVSELQPGDSITFTITLVTSADADTDWWMSNKVLQSFEDASAAAGGAYEYVLTFNGPSGNNVLYSSQTVGGENTTGGEGLHEATGALEDYFFLDTLSKGQTGTVTLEIALDGETQGNAYQGTLADIQLSFAVEEHVSNTNPTPKPEKEDVPLTGDNNRPIIYLAALGGSGCILLALGFVALRRNRKNKEAVEGAAGAEDAKEKQ